MSDKTAPVNPHVALVPPAETWHQPDRPMIVLDPGVNGGDPALYRSRVRVENILERLDAGDDPEDVAEDHGLTRGDVLVACWFDARYGVDDHPRKEWLGWWEQWEPSLWQAKTAQDYESIPFPFEPAVPSAQEEDDQHG